MSLLDPRPMYYQQHISLRVPLGQEAQTLPARASAIYPYCSKHIVLYEYDQLIYPRPLSSFPSEVARIPTGVRLHSSTVQSISLIVQYHTQAQCLSIRPEYFFGASSTYSGVMQQSTIISAIAMPASIQGLSVTVAQ